jgi:hypothetical protein
MFAPRINIVHQLLFVVAPATWQRTLYHVLAQVVSEQILLLMLQLTVKAWGTVFVQQQS